MNKNYKRGGLSLLGVSNSGKPTFLKLFKGLFRSWEVGSIQCPTGNNPSSFMFQNCVNTHMYICNEMRFENPNLIQVLKEFFEDSKSMFADVKYKDAIRLDSKPLDMAMNTRDIGDAFKHVPEEINAFSNRFIVLTFNESLTDYSREEEVSVLHDCSPELGYLLNKYGIEIKPATVNFKCYIYYKNLHRFAVGSAVSSCSSNCAGSDIGNIAGLE